MISEGYLICVDGESLENLGTILEKNCALIAINEVIPTRILAVTKKKEILVYDFEEVPFGFKLMDRKFTLQEIPH